MTSLALSQPGKCLAADEAMTAERDEIKFVVPYDGVDGLVEDLSGGLPSHRFTGENANLLPDPHHFVTTIYFDTPSRTHFRLASSNVHQNVKLRAKEYYDIHPSLAELATDPSEILRHQPWLWFELKRRDGSRTGKRRVRLRKVDVPRFLAGEYAVADLSPGPRAERDLEHLIEYCRSLNEPVSASCLVNYRRLSWQDEVGAIRVTLDVDLRFFAPPPDLWIREAPLIRSSLGLMRDREPRVLVEVKQRGTLPAWLGEALGRAGASQAAFSKFVRANEAVYVHG